MSLPLPIFPDCPHRHEASTSCLFASGLLGLRLGVTPAFCQYTCRKHHGPVGGVSVTKDQTEHFLSYVLNMIFSSSLRRGFLDRILNKYKGSSSIIVPERIEELRTVLRPVLEHPLVSKICLTGSYIVKEAVGPQKDIDVVVVVEDMEGYFDSMKELHGLLPDTLLGVKADYFPMRYPSGFFVALDIYDLILYKSTSMHFRSVEPPIETVLFRDNFGLYNKFTEGGEAIAERRRDYELRIIESMSEAEAKLVETRRIECEKCDQMRSVFAATIRCGKCDCMGIDAREPGNDCPLGLWPGIDAEMLEEVGAL